MSQTCGQCNNPGLCAYCINGELDTEGQQKLARIQEGRRIVEQLINKEEPVLTEQAIYSCRS